MTTTQSYKSVLLVDDDPTQIAILMAYFIGQRVGTVMKAGDPCEALAILEEHVDTIDLIVSDLQMPNMDGVEFLRHLKELGYNKNLAIASGVAQDLIDHTARLAKMHGLNLIGCIQKPLTKRMLDAVFLGQVTVNQPAEPKDVRPFDLEEFTKAMRNGEIIPHYQPQFELKTGKIAGAEALARWPRVEGGSVSPMVFIEFAEKNDLVEELTFRLFDLVLANLKTFLAIDPDLKIAVNLAPVMMQNIKLPDQLCEKMRNTGIKPANIRLEVTESSILDLDTNTLEVLSRFRISGIEVAIDDFGTGSANINTLRDFPYSELKIDQSFIKNVTSDEFSGETVRTSIALARQLGMHVVAEGVQNEEVLDFIRSKGIEQAQGFFLAKPMSAEDFVEFIQRDSSKIATGSPNSIAS